MPKGNATSIGVEAIALILGVIAGFLAWYQIGGGGGGYSVGGGGGYNLPDSYSLAVTYATKGASALQAANSLGAMVASNAVSSTLAAVMWVIVLFFWPAMLVSGLINLVGRTIRWQPFLWGVIAFIGAWVFMYENGGSLGYGGWLDLVAAILFLVAYLMARASSPKASMTPITTSTPIP